jgi:hypothetical protein
MRSRRTLCERATKSRKEMRRFFREKVFLIRFKRREIKSESDHDY